MCWIPKYAILIMFSTVSTYFCAYLIDSIVNEKNRKIALWANIFSNLAILFIFKYFNFFADIINSFFHSLNINFIINNYDLLLPVGISFYTFQSLGYAIDVYRKDLRHERNFINYALFVSFFPQLVAGPIERAKNLLPQFREKHFFSYENSVSGLRIIAIGLFKKIAVADVVGLFVNQVYNNIFQYSGVTILFATLLFALQIYCDFSGYSDIAVGSARILGFRLMENFRTPYFSSSISEFWSRWHISLSTWFKDYVYVPLGGNKRGFVRKCINLMLVFLLSGIWHGANLTFVAWGFLHGVYRITEEYIKKIEKHYNLGFLASSKLYVFKIIITFTLVCFAWIFFRANSIGDAFYAITKVSTIISGNGINEFKLYMTLMLRDIISEYAYAKIMLILFIALSVTLLFYIDWINMYRLKNREFTYWFETKKLSCRWFAYWLLGIFVFFAILVLNSGIGRKVQFIYFQF